MASIRKAFLDALARGESEPASAPYGDGYTILFGGGRFTDFSEFPDWDGVRFGGSMTHAAGRYQFEPATWDECAARLRLPDFSPASQDAAAWDLAKRVYWRRKGSNLEVALAAGTTAALAGVAAVLHSTWTSLSAAKFPRRYRAALDAK
jgi:muramidase (phage lysozyme)